MKFAIVFVAVVLILSQAPVRAQNDLTITFDGPPAPSPGSAYVTTSYAEAGMSFTPLPGSSFIQMGANPPLSGPPDDGTAYVQAAGTESLKFRFSNGLPFDLVSVDLAEYSTVFQEPTTVHFVGYHPDGSTVSTDLTTDGIIDGTGPLADFQTFYFGKDWTHLARVEIPTFGWSLDNLVVSTPEPQASSFMLSATLVMFVRRLRKP
ncbi:MAG TPA: hypothetical protein VFD66_06880 [Verrucomicrobiae bacterium]|nr:hypothetical protein [Verrucomicrobiae bacterium]